MRNILKVIFLVLICLCCYLAYQQFQKIKTENIRPALVSNNDREVVEAFSSVISCPTLPKLYDVNYVRTQSDYNTKNDSKQFIKYYLDGVETAATNEKKFYYLIHSKQPFHNEISNEMDADEIGDIRQSAHFIYVMNKARTMLMRADRTKLDDAGYVNLLQPMSSYVETDLVESRMITSWGVSSDTIRSEQYICLYVKNFTDTTKSYLVMFKPTAQNVKVFIDTDNIANLNTNPEKIFYVIINLDLQGGIYLKRNVEQNFQTEDETKNIYSLYANNFTSPNKSEIVRIDLDTVAGTINGSKNVIYTDTLVENDKIYPWNCITEISVIYQKLENFKSLTVDDYKKYTVLKELFDTKIKLFFDTSTENSKYHILNNYFADTDDIRIKNRFKMYRLLSDILHSFSKLYYIGGIHDIRVDEETQLLYFTKNLSGGNPVSLHKIKEKINELNISTTTSPISVTIIDIDSETRNLRETYNGLSIPSSSITQEHLKSLKDFADDLENKSNILLSIYISEDTEFRDTSGASQNILGVYLIQTYNLKPSEADGSQDLKQFYHYTDNFALQNVDLNVIGVLKFNEVAYNAESSPKIKNFIKFPRNVIYTVYQKIVNNTDKGRVSFARYNVRDISNSSNESIPAQKFNYNKDSLNEEFTKFWNLKLEQDAPQISKPSLFQAFKENTLAAGNPPDNKKFIDFIDWIHLFNLLRAEGLYDIKNQDTISYTTVYNSIENNTFFNQNSDKWTSKHQRFIRQTNQNIYDEDVLKYFPNILVFDLLGEKLESNDSNNETGVYLHLKYKNISSDIQYTEDFKNEVVDSEYHFLEMIYDGTRGLPSKQNIFTNTIDDKKYDYYKLMSTPKNEVLKKPLTDRNSFIWQRKTISNFNEFLTFILEDIKNEEDSRDRLRGIYEIPDIYIDDDYISYLEDSRTAIDKEKLTEIIEEKKIQKNKNMIRIATDDGLQRLNLIAYPFIVYYKYIDYNGLPCEPFTKNKQKIILSNRILAADIFTNKRKDTKKNKFLNMNYRYPLIKQEFFSFSGHGNIIQYYDKKFGGITSIEPKKTCGIQESTFLDNCSKNPNTDCQETILSYVSVSGQPKCEIDDDGVLKYNVSPVEVLLPQAVPKNACKIYLLKGSSKIYFTLGKIFGHGTVKYQKKNLYTIKNKNGKYLYKDGNEIKEGDESIIQDDQGETREDFIFKAVTESDNYGRYYLFKPFVFASNPNGPFLTATYHPFQHTLGGQTVLDAIPHLIFKLENKKQLGPDRNFINDEEYYSQKFNMSSSLLYNTMADQKTQDEELEKIKRQKMIEDALAAEFFPEYAVGDKSFKPVISSEEEQQALQRLLNDINIYQKNMLRIDPIELPNLESLSIELEKIQETIKARVPLIRKRIEGLRYDVKVSEIIDTPSIYSNLGKIPKKPMPDISRNNMSDNNKKEMERKKLQAMGSALDAIKDFIPKTERKPSQCKALFEGFENMYDQTHMSNHMVDKYNQFVSDRVNATNQKLGEIKSNLYDDLKTIGTKMEDLNFNSKKEQIILNQHIEDSMDIPQTVYDIRDSEQTMRMDRIENKIDEVKKLRCQLGDLKVQDRAKDLPYYNSIISREDGSLLNVYQISKCDKLSKEDVKLNKNMIFVNGGCLEYDEEKEKLKVDHCLVNNPNQLFELHHLKKEEDYQKFNILNNLKPGEILESPHYIISKPNTKLNTPIPSEEEDPMSPSIYSDDKCDFNYAKFNTYESNVDEQSCLPHKSNARCLYTEEGQLSMRDCADVKPQKWDYSAMTGPCK